jgi:hypothetical protein
MTIRRPSPPPGSVYLTGRSPRALWHRFLMWRAYNRPVTFRDLRRIGWHLCYRDGDVYRPCPVGEASLGLTINTAERPVFGDAADPAP